MLRIGRSSARASAEAKAKSKSEAREFGEEGWPVGAVLLTVDMLWGGKDGPNFGVGLCSEIWLRWEGPRLCWHSSCFWSSFYIMEVQKFGLCSDVSQSSRWKVSLNVACSFRCA